MYTLDINIWTFCRQNKLQMSVSFERLAQFDSPNNQARDGE